MTPKQIRAGKMVQILMCICDHYRVNHTDIANWKGPKENANWNAPKSMKATSARQIYIYHLHECGMSYEAIAKHMHLGPKTVTEHRAKGKRIVLNGLRDFVDELPRVTTTLQLINK